MREGQCFQTSNMGFRQLHAAGASAPRVAAVVMCSSSNSLHADWRRRPRPARARHEPRGGHGQGLWLGRHRQCRASVGRRSSGRGHGHRERTAGQEAGRSDDGRSGRSRGRGGTALGCGGASSATTAWTYVLAEVLLFPWRCAGRGRRRACLGRGAPFACHGALCSCKSHSRLLAEPLRGARNEFAAPAGQRGAGLLGGGLNQHVEQLRGIPHEKCGLARRHHAASHGCIE